jgi:tight adherence protein B
VRTERPPFRSGALRAREAVLIEILAGIGVGALAAGVIGYGVRLRRRDEVRGRLIRPAETAPVRTADAPLSWSWREAKRPVAVRWLGANFRRAGIRAGSFEMLLLMTLGALLLGGAAHAALHKPHWSATAAALGAWLPCAAVAALAARRIATLERQLADALDAIIAALQAGVALRQAMETVRNHHRAPIAAEFNEILTRIDAGAQASEVLRDAALLLRSKEFDLFATTLAAKWETGGNLTAMLVGLSRRIRESIRLRRRVLSLTAEARFSALVLFLMPYLIGVFVWMTVPQNIVVLVRHPVGRMLLEIAVLLQVGGAVWMMHLLRKEDL